MVRKRLKQKGPVMIRTFFSKNPTIRALAASLAGALLVTAIIGFAGILDKLDGMAQDALYQQPTALSGEIIMICIDDKALDQFGPYNTWDRNIMAQALEKLSSEPGHVPAVVAIDTIYTGHTTPEADQRLADAASKLDVVTASFAQIGTQIAQDAEGNYYYDQNAVSGYSLPYEELKDVTTQGHVNAVCDPDGILRHALLSIDVDGEKIYSMAYTTAQKYADRMGMTIREPETMGGYYYVSYSALPEGFYDGYSLADLINGEIPADAYEDKIVMIGPYAVGLQDEYFTAIDHSRHMYGMEYQANVIQMILDGNYKGELPDLPQRIVLFVVCFLSFFAFQKTSFKWSSTVMVALVGLSLAVTYAMYSAGIVMHPLWVPVGIVLLYLVSVVLKYLRSALEKQRVTRTFERYVAPEIVAEILKEGTENLSLGGKLCDIAVLFVDVRGFTTMSERLDPEKVVYILNRYLTMASGCVEKNRGTLDKFVGDAMMAFWGAPIPQEDAVLNAVRTAADIVKGAEKVSLELKDEIGEELNVGVGVHYGPAVVGNMGAERHMDYTAIGDTVNTAARLEANAPKGTVYISRSVADALGDGIAYVSLGNTVHLKGKSDFEVLQLDPDHSKFLTNSFNMDS